MNKEYLEEIGANSQEDYPNLLKKRVEDARALVQEAESMLDGELSGEEKELWEARLVNRKGELRRLEEELGSATEKMEEVAA